MLKIHYDPGSDVLSLVLRNDPPADATEPPGGVIVSYSEEGEPVTVEFQNAATRGLIERGSLGVQTHLRVGRPGRERRRLEDEAMDHVEGTQNPGGPACQRAR